MNFMNNSNYERTTTDEIAAQKADEAWVKISPEKYEFPQPRIWEVEELRLAAISTEEIDDTDVEFIFERTAIKSEDDIKEIFAILAKYRPELNKQIAQQILGG